MSQSGQHMLLKPTQIDSLPHLSPELKAQYKHGLANLWALWESHPDGSPKKEEAETKIRTASTKLMQQLAQARGGGRPASGGGPPRPGQPQQGGAQQQQQQQMGQQGTQQQLAQAQAQAQVQAQARQAGQAGQPSGQQPQQINRLNDRSQADLDAVVLVRPHNTPDAQWENVKTNWRREAVNILGRRDAILTRARQMSTQIQSMQKQGVDVQPLMLKQFEDVKKAIEVANNRWKTWKAQGEGQGAAQQQQPPNGQLHQRPATQQGNNANTTTAQSQPQPSQPPDAKPVNSEQPVPASPQQPQNGFASQQQPPQATQGQAQHSTPTQQGQQGIQAQQQQPAAAQQQQQGQQSAPPPQVNPTFAQQQQARPPPINTQSAMGASQSTPASAAQQNQQRQPQALNHQQAMSQAAEHYSRSQQQAQTQQQQQQPQQQPQLPNGLPFSQQPSSATQQNTPNSVYPNLQTTQQSSASTKFPIPKTLTLDPRTQTAVAGPASRPTLNNQGMMYNPGVQRPPPYTLEGEGDRVLSKRKLDELVRQVTGAAPSSDNSESSSVLTPDVEESMLQVADDFVDAVITSACRLAKLRPNQTLDVRDVQMVLERNYGIRIPGYSLDEVRTVRKFQPAPGWQTKMQAVQAGKVMGSKDS